jgi:hypothetical protein
MEQEKSVLRWGGLAGILGAAVLILVMVFVGVVIGAGPDALDGQVARFADIQILRVVENGVYLVGLLLAICLFLSLFWSLRESRLAPALFGSVIGIVGLIAMAVSATPHVAHAPLSELYQAAGATSEAQSTIAILWQAVWGVFNAPLYVGFFSVPIGILLLGVAMIGTPTFGQIIGWISVVLGVAGIVAAVLQMIDPAGPFGMGSYFAIVIFTLVLGIKVYSVSRTS